MFKYPYMFKCSNIYIHVQIYTYMFKCSNIIIHTCSSDELSANMITARDEISCEDQAGNNSTDVSFAFKGLRP